MDIDTKPARRRNPEHQSTSSSPEILEETNQPARGISIEEATARITKERAALTEKLKKVDNELAECDREINNLPNYLDVPERFYWNRIKSTLYKKRQMYYCHINMLDQTSMSLEEAELKSMAESVQRMAESVRRNVRRKVG